MASTKNLNINIDLSSFENFFNQLGNRISQMNGADAAFVILSLIMPSIAVLLKVGLTTQFWVNLLLTLLGFVPGQIHAVWVVLFLK